MENLKKNNKMLCIKIELNFVLMGKALVLTNALFIGVSSTHTAFASPASSVGRASDF